MKDHALLPGPKSKLGAPFLTVPVDVMYSTRPARAKLSVKEYFANRAPPLVDAECRIPIEAFFGTDVY